MVIPSLKNGKSPSLAVFEGGLFGPFSDGEIVLGFEKTSPVLFVAVKSCRDGNNIIGSLCLKTLLKLFEKALSIIAFGMEITHFAGATESICRTITIMKIKIEDETIFD